MKIMLTLLVAVLPFGAIRAPLTQPVGSPTAPLEATTGETVLAGCFNMWYCGGGHYMLQGPVGAYQVYHGECKICIDQGGCHDGCGATEAGKKADYARMVAAAATADVDGLIEAAKTMPEYVYFNAQRDAVQVLACDQRTIIASVPVTGASRVLAAAHLQSISALQVAVGE